MFFLTKTILFTTIILLCVHWKKYVYTKFCLDCCVSEWHAHLYPYDNVCMAWGCFIVVLQEPHSMFTMIIVVCSMKRMCIPCLVLIGCCVRELRICAPYCNNMPWGCLLLFYRNYIVYQSCLHVCFIMIYRHITKFCCSKPFSSGMLFKCIAWGCLLLFHKNYIVYHNAYHDYFIEQHVFSSWLVVMSINYIYMASMSLS